MGDKLAGLSAYQMRDGVVRFTHTEVFDAYEGKGVGAALVRAALDDVRSRGLLVEPACPFVAAFIARHEDEYADLLSKGSAGGDRIVGDAELG